MRNKGSKIIALALLGITIFTSAVPSVAFAEELQISDETKQEITTSVEEATNELLDNASEVTNEVTEGVGEVVNNLTTEPAEEVAENEVAVTDSVEQLNEVVPNEELVSSTSTSLIINSTDDMTFSDETIVSVAKYDEYYVVTYDTADNAKIAFDTFTSQGIAVEYNNSIDKPEDVKEEELDKVENTSDEVESTEADNNKKTITVAVLDTGIADVSDDELLKNMVLDGYSVIDDSVYDNNGHGTVMANIIASSFRDTEMYSDTEIKILPIKVLDENGSGSVLSVYMGMEYALAHDADVINLSISGLGNSNILTNEINKAYNQGVTTVVAAGNNSDDVANYIPGNIDTAITVSAVRNEDNEKVFAEYSNHGSFVDFSAMGTYEMTYTDEAGKEIVTSVNGTSVASAYVTSYVAMLKALGREDVSETDVYASLQASVEDLGDEGFDEYFGNGYLEKDSIKEIKEHTADKEKDVDLEENEKDKEQKVGAAAPQPWDLGLDDVDYRYMVSGNDGWYYWVVLNPSAQAYWSVRFHANLNTKQIYDWQVLSNNVGRFEAWTDYFGSYVWNAENTEGWNGHDCYTFIALNAYFQSLQGSGGHINARIDHSGPLDAFWPSSPNVNMYVKSGGNRSATLSNCIALGECSWKERRPVGYGAIFQLENGTQTLRTRNFRFDGNDHYTYMLSTAANAVYVADGRSYYSYNDEFTHGQSTAVISNHHSNGSTRQYGESYVNIDHGYFHDCLQGVGVNNNVNITNTRFENCVNAIGITGQGGHDGGYCEGGINGLWNPWGSRGTINNCTINSNRDNEWTGDGHMAARGINIEGNYLANENSTSVAINDTSINTKGDGIYIEPKRKRNINIINTSVTSNDKIAYGIYINNSEGKVNLTNINVDRKNTGILNKAGTINIYGTTNIYNCSDKGIFNESGTVTIDRNAAINIHKNQTGIWNEKGATFNIDGGSYWNGYDTIGGIRSNTGQGIVNYGTLNLNPDPANNKRIDIAQNGYNGIYNEGVVNDKGAYIWGNNHAGVVNGADGTTNPTYIKTSGNFDNNGYEGLANRGNATVINSNIYNNGSNGVANHKTATISNSTIYNNGIKSGWAVSGVYNGGNITLTNDTIRNNRFINAWNNVGTMTINGGSYINEADNPEDDKDQDTNFGLWNNDTVTIKGGTFSGYNTDADLDYNDGVPDHGASCVWNNGTANVSGGEFKDSHYGLVNLSTLNQSGGNSNDNSVYDVYQNGDYNLSGTSRADKIFLCAGKIVNVVDAGSMLYNNNIFSLDLATNDRQVTREVVRVNDANYANYINKKLAILNANSFDLSNNADNKTYDGIQKYQTPWQEDLKPLKNGNDYNKQSSIGQVFNGNNNSIYLQGYYRYNYNNSSNVDIITPSGYAYEIGGYAVAQSFNQSGQYLAKVKDPEIRDYLKFVGWTYDKDWMSKNWADVRVLDKNYVHALGGNEQVYPVFDLQNVSIAYYGNGATKAKGVDAKQTKDGEYYFVQDSISNSDNTTYAENPYIRSEKATRYDKNKEQDEEYTKTYTYVGWSPIRDNDKTSTLYKGNGNYNTYKAGDKPANWTAMFMDAINKGHVSYDNGKAYINLYAIWDEAPDIDAVDIWLNYGTCQSYLDAGIMKDRLLQPDRVIASDREDGTDVVIDFYDYNEQELRDIINSTADFGGTSITYRVTDKSGNVNYKTVMVYLNRGEITSQEPVIEEGEDPLHPENNFTDATGTTYHYVVDENGEYKTRPAEIYCRNINYNNYMKHWKEDGSVDKAGFLNGALETYSKWYLDEDLKEQMLDAMEILEKDEGYPYEQTFDRETIAKIQDEIYSDANKMQMSYIRDVWKYQYMDFGCKSKPYHEKKLIKQGKI